MWNMDEVILRVVGSYQQCPKDETLGHDLLCPIPDETQDLFYCTPALSHMQGTIPKLFSVGAPDPA